MEQTHTILLVEDEDRLRQILKKMLGMFNYEVFEAENGQSALSLLTTHHNQVDLIISDINMPKMNGTELFQNITEKYPHIRCLLTTGYLEEHEKESIKNMGVQGIIFKPYQVKEVLQMVQTSLTNA